LGLPFLITGNLDAEGLQKLGTGKLIALRLKLTRTRGKLLCLADGTRNIEARQVCRAACACAIFAGLVGANRCARRCSDEPNSYCCSYE
jgi:hypothetical protein